MIAPRPRLLWAVALILLPAAAVMSQPGMALPGGAIAATLLLLAFGDALLAGRSLEGVSVDLPVRARLALDREGMIELGVSQPAGGTGSRRLRIGLPLPPEIHSADETIIAELKPENPRTLFNWPCTPLRRGNFPLGDIYLEGESPLGFWAARRRQPVRCELRVYPNLLAERRQAAALFLNRGGAGIHVRRQVGKGREFEKLREYIPGDAHEDVHWKASAKRGHPVTKVFQVERTQEVYVVIDTSRLSAKRPDGAIPTPTGADASTLERYITAALMLGMAAQRQGDRFGLLTFSDRVHSFVRAKTDKAHYQSCLNALYTLQPRIVTPDYDEACAFIRLRLRRRALIVFLTDIDDSVLAESFLRNLDLIRRQHLVVVNMLQPAGARPLFTLPAPTLDGLYEKLGGHLLWRRLRELDKQLQSRGVPLGLLENEKLSASLITQYLTIKGRQVL
jgi:uncharacterized protein (DUF58 family)